MALEFPDIEKIIKSAEALFTYVFGPDVHPFAKTIFAYFLLIIFLLGILWVILYLFGSIKQKIKDDIIPLFYDREQKQRSLLRRRFAQHIQLEIDRMSSKEEWRDYRFAELEAEVEAEGRRRLSGALFFLSSRRRGLWREKSLSKALQRSTEKVILLEGEPGSGKSVALRHVALALARRAQATNNTQSIVPIYVNLKGLERSPDQPINRDLIHDVVIQSLNRGNDRDVDVFLENEFAAGIEAGSWFFLFDSFDEIPEVLSSTAADDKVREYTDAIADFLLGMNQCRAVIASRQFRGPAYTG